MPINKNSYVSFVQKQNDEIKLETKVSSEGTPFKRPFLQIAKIPSKKLKTYEKISSRKTQKFYHHPQIKLLVTDFLLKMVQFSLS